jgi:UDP-glucose 4-epimerase
VGIGKVLITGANGFIGAHLWRYLASLDYQIIACTTSDDIPLYGQGATRYKLRLPDRHFEHIVRNEQPDWLIHCAGSSSVQQSLAQPSQDFENNVLATECLFQALNTASPTTRVIFMSSGAVYGNPVYLPIDELTPTHPISIYGFHKFMCELICQKYVANAQIPVSILRVFSVYGPGLRKQLLWDIYQKSRKAPVISLYGTGNETRDFIYIDDLAHAIHLVMRNARFDGSVVNIASGTTTTIKQMAQLMVKALGDTHTIEFLGQARPGDPNYWQVNIDILWALEMRSWLPIEHGIRRFVDWLRTDEKAQSCE